MMAYWITLYRGEHYHMSSTSCHILLIMWVAHLARKAISIGNYFWGRKWEGNVVFEGQKVAPRFLTQLDGIIVDEPGWKVKLCCTVGEAGKTRSSVFARLSCRWIYFFHTTVESSVLGRTEPLWPPQSAEFGQLKLTDLDLSVSGYESIQLENVKYVWFFEGILEHLLLLFCHASPSNKHSV